MNNISVFNYNGNNITFDNGECVMVNATEMAKPFGGKKRPKNWLSNQSTKDFIAALSEGRNTPSTDLVQVTYGDNGCTWMHEDVALEFARWLSPKFAIWCNDRIKELLRHGITATETTIETIIADPQSGIKLLQALQHEREQRARLQQENEHQAALIEQKEEVIILQGEEIRKAAPKVDYYEKVISSESLVTTSAIANSFGMAAQTLNKHLEKAGIQYRVGRTWLLKMPYSKWNLGRIVTTPYPKSDGTQGTNDLLKWNNRGRMFVVRLIENSYDVKKAIAYIKGEAQQQKPAQSAEA